MSVLTRRLLIVEDERLIASLLGDVLTRAGFAVEIAYSAREAVDAADAFDPDGALIDVHLGTGPSGLQLGQRLSAVRPDLRMIFLSRFGLPHPDDGVHSGLPPNSSFISKDFVDNPDELVSLVERALRDEAFSTVRQHPHAVAMHALTAVQLDMLRMAAAGLTNQMIARRTGTGVRNVEERLKRVYEALGIDAGSEVNPRVEAVRQYIAAFGIPAAPDAEIDDG